MTELACKKCKYINADTSICKNCGSSEFTKEWFGYVIILDPEKSEIAKKLGIKVPGKFALRVD
ncbi:MAG: DNA-directed RNA polymerase, subunit E'' [Archaeoglobaceae archaeon]|nr:DNA-directed RNA polymerase, subunit E'' [Archaeoglobaceae archaeon]MCX8151644.1 DNA-directed RNA polymerase, subunit E'' [Archaeoglobaceae archaeon]MDW8013078.1 transcription elongation factor subunit Spt4 [Archaeoglobaceae archaeon]